VTVTSTPIGSPSVSLTDIDTPNRIPAGESEPVSARLDCSGGSTEDVRLSIVTEGDSGSVTAERTLSVECKRDVCVERITGGAVEYSLGGNDSEECAVEIRSDDEVGVELSARARVEAYLDIEADGEVEVGMGGNSRIEGDLRITSGSDVEVELGGNSSIGGDLVIDAAGEIEVEGESRVEGSPDY